MARKRATAAGGAPAAGVAGGATATAAAGTPPASTATTTPAPPIPTASPSALVTIKPAKIKETDPVELQVLKSRLPNGQFNLFARVLNIADKGLNKKQVVFIREGDQLAATTNSQGDTACPFNPLTAPADGSKLNVTAHMSGIRDLTLMHIVQRVVKTPAQIAKDAANNRRAKWFLLATLALWLLCAFVIIPVWGFGKPWIDPQKFSLIPHPTELTEEQVAYNNLPGVKGTYLEIKPPRSAPSTVPTGKWQKPVFALVLLWSVFSVFYAILSIREEVTEAFRRGVDKIVDRHYATASARDPLFQRILAFSGHLKSIRRPEVMDITPPATTTVAATAAAGATTPAVGGAKNTFWELFRSDLLSDFLTEVVPEIFKALLAWLRRWR